MKHPISVPVLVLSVLPLTAPLTKAQSGGVYDLSWNTIDDGGGSSTGGIYSVIGTTGQPDAGALSGGIYTFAGGFWGAATAPLPSYATWIAGFGFSGPAAAGSADPDGDGSQNGIEYILGGIPNVAGALALPTTIASGGSIVFTFPRADAAETSDVTLTVESGTDLVTWPTVFTIGPNTAASSPGVSILENGTAADTITVTIAQGTARRIFARLKVTISQ